MVGERKRRVTVTLAMIKEIRTYLDQDKTTKEISELLNISYSTILGLCNKIMSGVPDDKLINKKGRKFQSDAQVRGVISATLLNDNALTQRGIAEHLADSGITRSQPTISKALKAMNITRKRLSLIPAERNSPRILEVRQLYARELLNILPERLVYLDETGLNLHTTQHYGYSVRNTKVFLCPNK